MPPPFRGGDAMRKVKSSELSGSGFGANWVPAFGKLKKSASSAAGLHAQGAPAVDAWDGSDVEVDLEPNMAPKALPFEHPPTSPRELVTASRGARGGNAVRAVYTLIGAEAGPRDRQPPKAAGTARDSHIASTRARTPPGSIGGKQKGTKVKAEGKSEPNLRKSADISPKELCKALALATPWSGAQFRPSEYVSPRPDSRGSLGPEGAAKLSKTSPESGVSFGPKAEAKSSQRSPEKGKHGERAREPGRAEGRERPATRINLEMREMPRSLRRALMMSEPVSDHFSDATAEDWAASEEGEAGWGACDAASVSDADSSAGEARTVLVHGGANKYWSDYCEDQEADGAASGTCSRDGGNDGGGSSEFAFPQTSSGGYPAERGAREGRGADSPPFCSESGALWAEMGVSGGSLEAQGIRDAAGSHVHKGKRRGSAGRHGDDGLDVMDLFLPVREEAYVQEGRGGQGARGAPSPAGESAVRGSYGSDLDGGELCSSQRTWGAKGGKSAGDRKLNYISNTGRRESNEVDGCRESFDSEEGPLVDTAFEVPRRCCKGPAGAAEGGGNKGAGYMYDTAHAITVNGDGGQAQAAWVWDGGMREAAEVLQTRSSRASSIPSVGYGRGLHTSGLAALPPELDPASGKVKGGCFDPSMIIGAIFRKLTGRSGRKESPWMNASLPMQLTLTGESMGDDNPNRIRTQRYMKRQSGIVKVVEERLQAADSGRRPSHRLYGEAYSQPRTDRSGAKCQVSTA